MAKQSRVGRPMKTLSSAPTMDAVQALMRLRPTLQKSDAATRSMTRVEIDMSLAPMLGAPHLARFLGDVGFHKPTPQHLYDSKQIKGTVRGIPRLPANTRSPQ